MTAVTLLLSVVLVGMAIGMVLYIRASEAAQSDRLSKREEAINAALKEAAEAGAKAQVETERVFREKQEDLRARERRLAQRETALDQKSETLDRRQAEMQINETQVARIQQEAESLRLEQLAALERVAGLTRDSAKTQLFGRLEDELAREMALKVKQVEQDTKEQADRRAREILTTAIQRTAVDHCVERTVSVVQLPTDEMKGRIIGREGRNIRALENATGIDLIIDDTPEAIILSSFDPVRREVARIAIERLIADGRIHPTRIEEQVDKARHEVEETIMAEGEKAVLELGVAGAHPEVLRTLGRLRYRTSYGQNVLAHTKEVAHVCAAIAAELGANVAVAKRAALFHDLGKAVSHEQEGAHAVIGADLAQKYGERPEVVHAIRAHHYDVEPASIEACLVLLSDAISAARPGARRENIDICIKRLEKIEEIARSFTGIDRVFAVQAGREVRVMVAPDVVDDVMAAKIARDVAKRIETEMEYPGMIKVTVIREVRTTEFAK